MASQLPILQVAVPLLSAPACAMLGSGRFAWALATTVSAATFFMSTALLAQVLLGGPVAYELGGWAAPWGIELRVDAANAFVLLVVSGIALIVAAAARLSVEKEIPRENIALFYTAFLLCLAGLLGITVTGDAFNVFVFLEISSLSTYSMIALGKDRRALTASFRYLIMGTIGATFILIGVGFMYMMTGTLNMADLAQRLPEVSDTRTVRAAFAFLIVGVSLKAALFPLHLWLPNAYAYAPSIVTTFLAATATKVALYVLLRFFFTVFGADFSFNVMQLDYVLLPLSLIAAFAGSVVAIFQEDIKRMLAYSSVAQIGYITLGISFATTTGVTGGIVHIFNHALMKGALFLTLTCVVYRVGSAHIDTFAGLGKRMPWTMAAFVAGGLSLIGVPLTVGFISKWYLILAALEKGWWFVAALIVLTSLLAVIYIWRVVEVAYFRPASDDEQAVTEAPLSLLVPVWILVAANVYFGIDASLTTGVAGTAAQQLLGVTP
ncbi:MAG: monovalent cation/H+ antiporter subunit D family protein [Gammaproteobacteria bacterium]